MHGRMSGWKTSDGCEKIKPLIIKDGKKTLIKTRLKPLREAFHQTFGGLI